MRSLLAVNPDARAGRVLSQGTEAVGKTLDEYVSGGVNERGQAASRVIWLPPGSAASGAATGTTTPTARVMAELLGSSDRGTPIELPLLMAALVLALIEIGLARWASHAEVLPSAVRQAAGAVTGGVMGSALGGRATEAGA